MSVRRRQIKERVERNRRWLEGHEALTLSLHGIQRAITAAMARGETEVTDRFLREAFLATSAPASSEETAVEPAVKCEHCGFLAGHADSCVTQVEL